MAILTKSKLKVKAIVVLIASMIGGILYRMGGSGNYPRQARVVGVALLSCALLAVLQFNWWIFLCLPLMIGALSTYWKKKGSSGLWWNWLLTGLGYSLAFLPFAIASGKWLGFCLRSLICMVATTIWSEKISNAVIEEFGRGFIAVATIPLLLI